MTQTIAIRHPKDPARPTVIALAMYDPARHELWDARPYGETETERAGTGTDTGDTPTGSGDRELTDGD